MTVTTKGSRTTPYDQLTNLGGGADHMYTMNRPCVLSSLPCLGHIQTLTTIQASWTRLDAHEKWYMVPPSVPLCPLFACTDDRTVAVHVCCNPAHFFGTWQKTSKNHGFPSVFPQFPWKTCSSTSTFLSSVSHGRLAEGNASNVSRARSHWEVFS